MLNPKLKYCTIQVEFLGEEGIDTGSVTREFFKFVGYHAAFKYFELTGCFKHNYVALQVMLLISNCLSQLTIICVLRRVSSFHLGSYRPCPFFVEVVQYAYFLHQYTIFCVA